MNDSVEAPAISGHTRLYGIVADPIDHVQTPQRLNALMHAHGVDGVVVPFHVAPDDLPRFIEGLRAQRNFGGFVATVPHKSAMLLLCDRASDRARAIGAVNVVRRGSDGSLAGDMLDGAGFVAGLRASGVEPRGRTVLLAGAGGAASAIAFALADAGVRSLTLCNRTTSRAADLAARLSKHDPALRLAVGTADPSGHDLVVNATSLGLRAGDPLPLQADRLTPRMTVAEIVMQPQTTPLLARAIEAGCSIVRGAPMLDCQLGLMARFLGMIA